MKKHKNPISRILKKFKSINSKSSLSDEDITYINAINSFFELPQKSKTMKKHKMSFVNWYGLFLVILGMIACAKMVIVSKDAVTGISGLFAFCWGIYMMSEVKR